MGAAGEWRVNDLMDILSMAQLSVSLLVMFSTRNPELFQTKLNFVSERSHKNVQITQTHSWAAKTLFPG